MKYFKKLVGDNIYLSPRNTEDIEKYVEWLNDFQITDYTGRSSQLITIESEKKYFEEHINDEAAFSIVRLEDDEMIGRISLEKVNHTNRTATLGIFIGDKDSRNKGLGTEAIKLILDYGFNYMNLNNIMLDVLDVNARAIACYKKCGFKEIGRRREANFTNGKYHDIVSMDILAREFDGDFIRNKNI